MATNTGANKYIAAGNTPNPGTKGDAVLQYQKDLNKKNAGQSGYAPIKEDGLYGPKTYAASQYKGLNTKNQSTTTLSSDKSKDISTNNATLDELSKKGVTTDTEGNKRYADDSFEEQETVKADTEDEDAIINSYFKSLKSSLDANTKGQIDNIEQKFAQRKQEQEEINRRAERGMQTSLLMGGVTGQGSSAQFAPISSEGIMQAQESYGLSQIAALDSQENDLISQARQAQTEGEFRIMEKKLEQVQEKRKEKIEAAAKLNEQISKSNEKLREQRLQMEKEGAIADVYASGITDTAEAVKKLRESGIPATTKEVSDTIALLSGQGGTGIVGEYNFYRSQAKAAGQVPVDFNTYQDIDANRKKSIAAAGVAGSSGLNSKQVTIFNSLVDKYNKSPLVAANDRTIVLKTVSDQLKKDPTNAALQVSFIYSMIQALDTYQSAVREGEIGLLESTQGIAEKLKNLPSKIQKGNPLGVNKINEYIAVANTLAGTIESAAKQKQKTFGAQADIAGIGGAFSEYTSAVNEANTGSDLVKNGEEAKQAVQEYIVSHGDTKESKQIIAMANEGVSQNEIYDWLKQRGEL